LTGDVARRRSTSRPLRRDLDLWEEGRRSLAEVRERHPGVDVDAVAALHTRISAVAKEDDPGPERIWQIIERRLDDPRIRQDGRVLATFLVVAAVAAATLRWLVDHNRG
jgi:hypothetical protein